MDLKPNSVEAYLIPIARWQRSLGYNHSLEQFCLTYGRKWETVSTDPLEHGRRRMCFMNAAHLVERSRELVYVEGYACPWELITVHHAWCLAGKEIVDPTWQNPPTADYWGVPFSTEFLLRQLVDRKVYGLLDTNESLIFEKIEPRTFLHSDWADEILSREKDWWMRDWWGGNCHEGASATEG